MPLPFLLFAAPAVSLITAELLGAGVVATGAAIGAKKVFDSKETYEKAETISKNAETRYNKKKAILDDKVENTVTTLDKFGEDQLEILKSFEEFVRLVKILHKESIFAKIDKGYKFEPVEIEKLEKVSIAADVITGAICSGVKGVATGLTAKGTIAEISKIIVHFTGKESLNLLGKEAVKQVLITSLKASTEGIATGAASGFAAGMGAGAASGFAAGMGAGVAGGFASGVGAGAAGGIAGAIGGGATVGMLGGPIGAGLGIAVGAICGCYSLAKNADSTLEKSRKIESQADEAIKNINKIISYLDDLTDTTEKYKMVMSATKKVYDKELDKLRSVVSKKTNYDRFTPDEKLLLENTSLLVKLLYQMCKIKLVKKGEKGVEEVNKQDINEIEMETINYLETTGEHDTLMAAYEKK